MRRLIAVASVLVFLCAGMAAAQSRVIGGSVDSHTPDPAPATASGVQFCFTVTNTTPDLNFMDRFDIDLPDAWTVDSVQNTPLDSFCSGSTTQGYGAGNVVYWERDGTIPSGCGPWDDSTRQFCVTVSYAAWDGPFNLDWNMVGDGWGSPPNTASGTYGPMVPVELETFTVE